MANVTLSNTQSRQWLRECDEWLEKCGSVSNLRWDLISNKDCCVHIPNIMEYKSCFIDYKNLSPRHHTLEMSSVFNTQLLTLGYVHTGMSSWEYISNFTVYNIPCNTPQEVIWDESDFSRYRGVIKGMREKLLVVTKRGFGINIDSKDVGVLDIAVTTPIPYIDKDVFDKEVHRMREVVNSMDGPEIIREVKKRRWWQ